jgi:hypothetical protein
VRYGEVATLHPRATEDPITDDRTAPVELMYFSLKEIEIADQEAARRATFWSNNPEVQVLLSFEDCLLASQAARPS